VWEAASSPSEFQLLYPDEMPLAQKIETIATQIYGADGVDYAAGAAKDLAEYERLGYAHLPVCMAKTHLSISHDPALLGRPRGFRVPIREVKLAAGAGFIYPLAGDMRTLPGLPSRPAGNSIDIDEQGRPVGLF
jgi:formyltetrahydrofolate synthetase